jgi:tetratricopeptide (TPR) repeat protein
VQRYLADEPVLACPPSAGYRLRKFARRRRAGLLTAAAAILVVLLTTSGVGWVWWDRAGRHGETDRTVSVALARAEEWAGQAEGRPATTSAQAAEVLGVWLQAEAALAEAEVALRTGEADAAMRQRVADMRRRLEQGRSQTEQRRTLRLRQERLLRALDEARQRRATLLGTTYDHAGAAAQYQSAFAAYGLAVEPGRTAELGQRIRAEEPAVREAVLVALDDWTYAAHNAGMPSFVTALRELAAAADADEWRTRYRTASAAKDRATLRELAVQARKLSLPPSTLELLALSLTTADERDEALALLRWARARHPTDFWIAMHLGMRLRKGQEQKPVPVDLEERIGCFRVAVALRPDASAAHNNLGDALWEKGELDEVIAESRKSIDINPRDAGTHSNLGLALKAKGQLDDAIAAYHKAIEVDPKFALAHNNLGLALRDKGQPDDAIAAFRAAIASDPGYVAAHVNLGQALKAKGQLNDAIAAYRAALAIDARDAPIHNCLGNALWAKGQQDDATAAYREAVAIDPRFAPAQYNLGGALKAKGHLDDAIAAYRAAIASDPKEGMIHGALATALQMKGRFAEATASAQQALKLLARNHPMQPAALQLLQQCQTLLALEAKLPDILAGKVQPADRREWLGFLEVCRLQQRHAAAAALYSAAFAADAVLADDLKASHRYNAACAAALAAAGQGEDAAKLSDQERARLRHQALAWLRADLALRRKQLQSGWPDEATQARTALAHWQKDSDLASVRDATALNKLPAEEQQAWRKLWDDVAQLLPKGGDGK